MEGGASCKCKILQLPVVVCVLEMANSHFSLNSFAEPLDVGDYL